MQTPKTKPGSLDVSQRKSPATTTPRTARQLKTPGSDANTTRTPKSSPKVVDRRSPRSPASEKKRMNRPVSELEPELSKLREELKKAKDQLGLAELVKRQALTDAEEAKNELSAMSARLDESERQLSEFSICEDDRIHELRKLSQERDKAWESELEAVQRQHSMDSSALASAINEVQKLKSELSSLRDELGDREARVRSLENLVKKLQAEVINGSGQKVNDGVDSGEIQRLRSALDAGEIRYQEEFIQSTLKIRSAYEQAERAKAELTQKETELSESKLRVAELKALLMEHEESTESEREAVMKLGYATEEAEKNGRRAARVSEQLEAAVAERSEMESELRRVKVQADQWRKAAEAAASMISGENDGKIDSVYNLMGSPFSEDMDDESPKKKNGNVLKKIGVLWKKGQK